MEPVKLPFRKQNFPIVMKNKIRNWKVLSYTREDWCHLFKGKQLKFRRGKKTYSEVPHWEHLCDSMEMSLNEFFELSDKTSDHWLYFDYKYVKDVFQRGEFVNGINWADVGVTELSGEESTLWIGNEGAHTPCHKDTYGFNLVAQIFGRKLWILIPPKETENLKPARVPYEESSVYSLINFYTPNHNLLSIKEAYKVILSPGEVLYVPRHWWHYVENLETAISVNIWIPLVEDYESRLEESLVQHYISNICQDLSEEEAKQILNPNEYSLITKPCTISLIEECLEQYKKHKNDMEEVEGVSEFQADFEEINKFSMESFIKEKNVQSKPPSSEGLQDNINRKVSIVKALINVYCCQSNINLLKKALLE